MKKTILLMLFTAVFSSTLIAGDIPFFKSLFIGDEEYVRQEILKCKDVKKVEVERRALYQDDDIYRIHVYLSNYRYIQFSGQLYHFVSDMTIFQINDLHPIEQCFMVKHYDFGNEFFRVENHLLENKLLKRIAPQLKVDNVFDIISNLDTVYSFISELPELPDGESFYIKKFDYKYREPLENQIPEELKNDIPFSILEKKKDGTYESGYKFYKTSIERAVKEFGYDNLKYDYEKF
ncbi:MAG: hypothetical protein J5798_06950 [Spirochaetaceae bacterium]|nr:hypothetical protein [Spirochaetaceae bacterium]